ncbi:PCI-domain-containing protein [Amylocystis lapponica]|nr:PCI-domain-containing protein [Amylocystis lapponica]
MAVADSVSVFAEGTFSEQIRELVEYLARTLPEDQRSSYAQPFQDALVVPEGGKPIDEDEDRRRTVFTMVLGDVKGLGDGSDKEIEGFFNLLFSHFLALLSLDSPDTQTRLTDLLQVISSSSDHATVKYRILSNLGNAIPRRSGLRLLVYTTLIEAASANDELNLIGFSRADVEKWLAEWDVSPEAKSNFLKLIADSYVKSGESEKAYEYKLSYVRSLPSNSPAVQSAALDAIATALRLPSLFDYDPLFRLDAVVAAKDHELFSLLQIFLNEGLPQYTAWAESHADAFVTYRKIRLLSLATLGFQNIGRDLPYATIATPCRAADWRLSQTTQTLHITRAAVRAFGHEQWVLLEKRLGAWKTGLVDVLEPSVIASAPSGIEASAAPAQTAAAA